MVVRVAAVAVAVVAMSAAAFAQAVAPFEAERTSTPASPLDQLVSAELATHGWHPARPCSDEVFCRRVYLDVTGTLPTPQETMAFLGDRSPTKRAALIDALLARPAFADYWSLKWCDLLRVKAEFPINLWPNGVQAYHRWIHDALATNRPYDRFARELLTSSGSNYRVPAVNFFRAVQGHEPAALAAAAALTFMGSRVETWPAARRAGLEAFFSRVAFKGTAEWKEEIVYGDPAATAPLTAVLPDGRRVTVPAGVDPRRTFADWLVAPDNPWFARAIVNRIWSWLLGRGIVHEPDDLRPDNPAANPALLAYLERECVEHGYDLRHIYRVILNSRTYQQSCIPAGSDPAIAAHFGCYPVRRLEAEVLVDALCWLTGAQTDYSSQIPEPFTFIPGTQRTILLADGSITSPFLELFGRPPRDTGTEGERNNTPTDRQRLFLMNASVIQTGIERSWLLRRLAWIGRGSPDRVIGSLYVSILSRRPTPAEVATAVAYLHAAGGNGRAAVADVAWALLNTKEFQYRH